MHAVHLLTQQDGGADEFRNSCTSQYPLAGSWLSAGRLEDYTSWTRRWQAAATKLQSAVRSANGKREN